MTLLSPWHEIKFNFNGIFFAQHVYLVNYKRYIDNFHTHCVNKARSKRRSIHAPNLTDELSTAEERRLNQFGSAD